MIRFVSSVVGASTPAAHWPNCTEAIRPNEKSLPAGLYLYRVQTHDGQLLAAGKLLLN